MRTIVEYIQTWNVIIDRCQISNCRLELTFQLNMARIYKIAENTRNWLAMKANKEEV